MKSHSLYVLFTAAAVAAASVAIALPVAASTTASHPAQRTDRALALSDMQAYTSAAELPRSAVVGMPACKNCH